MEVLYRRRPYILWIYVFFALRSIGLIYCIPLISKQCVYNMEVSQNDTPFLSFMFLGFGVPPLSNYPAFMEYWMSGKNSKSQKVYLSSTFRLFPIPSHLFDFSAFRLSSSLSTLNGLSSLLLAAHVQLEGILEKFSQNL